VGVPQYFNSLTKFSDWLNGAEKRTVIKIPQKKKSLASIVQYLERCWSRHVRCNRFRATPWFRAAPRCTLVGRRDWNVQLVLWIRVQPTHIHEFCVHGNHVINGTFQLAEWFAKTKYKNIYACWELSLKTYKCKVIYIWVQVLKVLRASEQCLL